MEWEEKSFGLTIFNSRHLEYSHQKPSIPKSVKSLNNFQSFLKYPTRWYWIMWLIPIYNSFMDLLACLIKQRDSHRYCIGRLQFCVLDASTVAIKRRNLYLENPTRCLLVVRLVYDTDIPSVTTCRLGSSPDGLGGPRCSCIAFEECRLLLAHL